MKTGNTPNESFELIFSILGLFISAVWCYADKGAKFWQENWELHIDLLEREITGNLYKTVLCYSNKDNAYSVSRVNAFIIRFFIVVWIVLVVTGALFLFGHDELVWLIQRYGYSSSKICGLVLAVVLAVGLNWLFFRSFSNDKKQHGNSRFFANPFKTCFSDDKGITIIPRHCHIKGYHSENA